MPPTHTVSNQVPPLVDFDVSAADPALHAALSAAGAPLTPRLRELAVDAGSAEILDAARLADSNPPMLRTHDRGGHRVDEVEYHPAWHTLMTRAVRSGLQAAPWAPGADRNAHLSRAAGFYLWTQAESGHLCPISMTYSAIPALRHSPSLAADYEKGLCSTEYDVGLRPAGAKSGLLAGMSMTEKQGGSDLRACTTIAVPVADSSSSGTEYRLTGHKWFTSAPMNDVFLTLAQAPGGLTCFLLPRVLPDGSRNAIALQRLKDKLGNRSNASSEIEYDAAAGWRIGDEGRGLPTILEMVTLTRLDCVLGSAGQMRAALTQAAHYASRRSAFGRRLADQPAMTAVLADLAVESWAATATAIRLASLMQAGQYPDGATNNGPVDAKRCRRAAPARPPGGQVLDLQALRPGDRRGAGVPGRQRVCRDLSDGTVAAGVAVERHLGGFRDGDGADALRAVERSPASGDALLDDLADTRGVSEPYDRAVDSLEDLLHQRPDQSAARRLSSLAARTLAASLLIRQAPAGIAELYCSTRLGGGGDRVFGDVPGGYPLRDLVDAVTPG